MEIANSNWQIGNELSLQLFRIKYIDMYSILDVGVFKTETISSCENSSKLSTSAKKIYTKALKLFEYC